MNLSPSPQPTGGGRRQFLTPTALEFTPKVVEAKKEVINSSFVTQTVPNAHRYAGIVGLCTVPEERADMNDLGWHIADFLAFRALFWGENNPRAQSWLALCDIPTLAEQNPERYFHGKDRRLVGFAARPEKRQASTALPERDDKIQVETSAEALKDNFITAVKGKLEILKRYEYPLLIIICGSTSVEQDVYFGNLDIHHRYTMKDFRHDLGDDINHVEAIIVTPALFSAGWQVNTSFGRSKPAQICGRWDDFLARQFGGLFAQNHAHNFTGWKCPALDEAKVDSQVKRERFPGPVCPSDEVKALISQLQIKIQSYLLGGLSTRHMDHSFSFDKTKDEWEILSGHRERSLDYQSLDWYQRRWSETPRSAQSPKSIDQGFAFLGNAFGGTKESQLSHISDLIKESYLAWPDHWASGFC